MMRFGRSLTIDLSLSRFMFLAWCLYLRDRGGDVRVLLHSLWRLFAWRDGEIPRAENLLAHSISFKS